MRTRQPKTAENKRRQDVRELYRFFRRVRGRVPLVRELEAYCGKGAMAVIDNRRPKL